MSQTNKALQLKLGYGGKPTGEVFYPAGVYDNTSPLWPLGDYLVTSGRAVWSDGSTPPVPVLTPPDRDLSGKPINIQLPQTGLLQNDPIQAIGHTFPNNADFSEVVYPFETGGAVPSMIMGAEQKAVGTPEVQTALEGVIERRIMDNLLDRLKSDREFAATLLAAANGEGDAPTKKEIKEAAGVISDPPLTGADAVAYDDVATEQLRATAAAAGIQVRSNEGRESLIKKLNELAAKEKPLS